MDTITEFDRIVELRIDRNQLVAALKAVRDEVTPGVRPIFVHSYLPPEVVRLVEEALAAAGEN